MKITSPAFEPNGTIPRIYTCDGDNINPPLEISEVPDAAQSLVLIVDDPDVPRDVRADGIWNHWLVYNLPPTTKKIEEDSLPEGEIGTGTSGRAEYQGPCPPDREHRYFFRLFALRTPLVLGEAAGRDRLDEAIDGQIIDKAELMGRYAPRGARGEG